LAPAALASGTLVQVAVLVSMAVGMAVGPPSIVRRIFEHDRITAQLVLAGLCAYIQVGFAFAFVFGALDLALPGDFFAQGEIAGFFDYVYFSFVTLTTVGYGDLSAARGFRTSSGGARNPDRADLPRGVGGVPGGDPRRRPKASRDE
jgi:hypothetical protein